MAEGASGGSPMNETGLSDDQCKEIHGYFIRGTTVWIGAAAIAHLLAYQWMPWFPG